MAIGGCVLDGIIFVIFFVVVVSGIASAFLLFHRKAVRDSRRVGAPDARRTATFRGGMWWPGKFNAGPGTMSLDFFDWGIRLGGGDLTRLFSPVWEARYEELTEARLVKAPTHQGIRLTHHPSALLVLVLVLAWWGVASPAWRLPGFSGLFLASRRVKPGEAIVQRRDAAAGSGTIAGEEDGCVLYRIA